MASANLTMGVKGVDKTGAAFNSVKRRAKSTGASIRSAFAGAFAAAGAYLGVRSIVSTINELGQLSDAAMRAGTTVDELTRSSNAFSVLGMKGLDVAGLGKAFAFMEKNTGRKGLAGFYETIGEIQKLPDAMQRGQAAVAAFGRGGVALLPLINAGEDAVKAVKAVEAAMPGIPQSAADAGDAASDAMSIATQQMKSIWAQGIGFVCKMADESFAGGIREAALLAGAYLEYYIKVAAVKVMGYFRDMQTTASAVGSSIGSFFGALASGASISEAWGYTTDAWNQEMAIGMEADKQDEERLARFKANLEKRKVAIADFAESYEKVSKLVSTRGSTMTDTATRTSSKKSTQIRNDLVLGGSNAARLLSVLGPQTQSETKKQTGYLKMIAENTAKTAEQMDGGDTENFDTVE